MKFHSVNVTCHSCSKTYSLMVNGEDVQRWRDGTLIQVAMPYLTKDDRELLISKTCGSCFDKMEEADEAGESEICFECGESVAWGSGKFVNRIPGDGGPDAAYPEGEWMCDECTVAITAEFESDSDDEPVV